MALTASQMGVLPLGHLAGEIIALFPDRVTAPLAEVRRELALVFSNLCANASQRIDRMEAASFHELLPSLRAFKAKIEAAHLACVAETAVTRSAWEALDYCSAERGIVLIEGAYRSGKSFSSQAWALARAGRVRYASLTAYNDHQNFLRTLASALGVVGSVRRTSAGLRDRILDVLRGGDIMLVIDEAEHLLEAHLRPKCVPEKLRFLMSLDNMGVPIALVAGANFSRQLAAVERTSPAFDFSQWHGRVRLHKRLPVALEEADLFAIAERLAPDAPEATRMLLVGHALGSKGRVAAMESLLRRARYFAQCENRPLSFGDVERAGEEAAPQPLGGRSAPMPRNSRRGTAVSIGNACKRLSAPIFSPAAR